MSGDGGRGRRWRGLLAVAVTVGAVLLAPTAAYADEGGPLGGGSGSGSGGGSGDGPPGGWNGGQGDQNPTGPQDPLGGGHNGSATSGNCDLFANQLTFGSQCGSGGAAGSLTWAQILGNQPFPQCRYSDLPDGFPPPRAPKDQTGQWVIETCLKNVTIHGVTPGQDVERQSQLVFFPNGKAIPRLTPAQLTVWNGLASRYPTPVILTGPVDPPRVNVPTTFWLGVTDEDAARARREIVTEGGQTFSTLVMHAAAGNGVQMRAFVNLTRVWPGVNDNEQPVQCAGGGVPRNDATGPVTAAECSFSYQQSSAHIKGDEYQLTIEADWVVQYQNGGQWQALGNVPITTTYKTKVDEIQAINN